MKDEQNKHKAIYKYAQGDLLFFSRDDLLNIVSNITTFNIITNFCT